jgi:hypothetical protein
MGLASGLGRVINGSGADRVSRSNLTEFRGNMWEPLNDWFFGYTTVDLDWQTTADSSKFRTWTYTSDGTQATTVNILPALHRAEIEATAGTSDGLSNLRELFVIDETSTWGVAHAQCEIVSGPKFLTGSTIDEGRLVIKPQHGIGLRAQEDTKRRTIIAWHDIAIGLPQSVNLGVWSGNLDGSGFLNRQIGIAMDLDEVYTITAATRVNDDDAGLVFDVTTGSNWQTPDHPSLDITGDFSATFDISPVDWTPVLHMSVWSKYTTTGNQRSYRWRLTNLGEIEVNVSTDGLSGASVKVFKTDAAGTAVLSALGGSVRKTIVIDYDADNGAGGTSCTFYVADAWNGPFTQLGATITVAGTTAAFVGTAIGEIGSVALGTTDRFWGRIHQLEIRPSRWDPDGNNATAPVVDVRPFLEDNAVTSFVANDGKTYTATGTSTLENTQKGTGTATIGTHALRVGDRVAVVVGEEHNITALQRVSGVASCTLPGGHTLFTGNYIRILFASDTSFNGSFACSVSGNTATWSDPGSDMSGHTGILWDNTYDHQTAEITSVTATTVTYASPGLARTTIPTTVNSKVVREFPYLMEMRVAGTVAQVRCWGRHQSVPDWMDEDRAIIADLSVPTRAYTVTNRQRTSNVATLTIGTHNMIVGERVTITGVTPTTYNSTMAVTTAITDTTFSYANTGTDEASTASSGTATAQGSGSTQAVIDANPTPTGSGRVAFAGAHIGTNDLCRCVYGPFFGDNDPDSQILAIAPDQETNYIRGQFTFPQVTAGQAGTPATATPAVIAQSFTLPASGENVGAGPAVVARSFVEPQPAVNIAAGPAVTTLSFLFPTSTESVAAGPAVLPLAWSLPQATPQAGSTVAPAVMARSFALGQAVENVGAGPAVVPLSFVLPAPAESVGAGPTVIARALTLPQAVESVGAVPAVIPLAFALPQAAPVTAGNATALPAVLAAIAAFPQALAQGGATVAPAVLAAIAAFGQAVESVSAGPLVIARAFALPQATPLTAGNATATPLVIDRLFAFGATVENVSAGPLVIARSFILPQAMPSLPALAAPAVLARSFVLPATAVVVAAAATPAAIAVLAALARPGVNVEVTPASLALVMLFGHPISGAFPPDPNPILISFTEGRNGLVSFDGRVGMLIFEEPA